MIPLWFAAYPWHRPSHLMQLLMVVDFLAMIFGGRISTDAHTPINFEHLLDMQRNCMKEIDLKEAVQP